MKQCVYYISIYIQLLNIGSLFGFWIWIYSIFILEFQVKITTRNGADGDPQKGKAFIHYNQKLCRKEIERLFTHFNIEDPGEMSADISYGTNGHKSVCR